MTNYNNFIDNKLKFTCEVGSYGPYMSLIIKLNLIDIYGTPQQLMIQESIDEHYIRHMDTTTIYYDLMDKLYKEVLKIKLHKLFNGCVDENDPMFQEIFGKLYVSRLKFIDVFFDQNSMDILKDIIENHLKQQ